MHKMLALIRAGWLTSTSYRLQTVLSFGGMVVSFVPLYFVAQALQPVMADSIRGEGDQYFGFVVVGMVALYLLNAAVQALPSKVRVSITYGTLEALLSTPAGLPSILGGMIGVDLLWAGARVLVLLVTGWLLGANLEWSELLLALVIMGLIVLAYLPFGLIGAALVVVFRTPGPVPQGVVYLSILLGGVYYPTQVIPSWIQTVSDMIPLTYGLRALRQVLLNSAPLGSVAADIGILMAFALSLFAMSTIVFRVAFRHARRSGTLTHY